MYIIFSDGFWPLAAAAKQPHPAAGAQHLAQPTVAYSAGNCRCCYRVMLSQPLALADSGRLRLAPAATMRAAAFTRYWVTMHGLPRQGRRNVWSDTHAAASGTTPTALSTKWLQQSVPRHGHSSLQLLLTASYTSSNVIADSDTVASGPAEQCRGGGGGTRQGMRGRRWSRSETGGLHHGTRDRGCIRDGRQTISTKNCW